MVEDGAHLRQVSGVRLASGGNLERGLLFAVVLALLLKKDSGLGWMGRSSAGRVARLRVLCFLGRTRG